ncbi:MAG: hypothetical protein ABL999_18535 [Pyrinomonadaceae bacterium]
MEITDPLNIYDQLDRSNTDDEGVAYNVELLREANAKIAQKKSFYPSRKSEIEATSLTLKLDFKKTYAYLGLMLGVFPPASLFALFIAESNAPSEIWLVALLLGVNAVTAFVGYFFGKVVGSLLYDRDNRSLSFYIFFLPFLGFLWGAIAGAVGGVFLFIIGAFFGAILGGAVGMVALPSFYAMHRILKHGEYLELKYFLPVATGIVYSISAVILSYIGRG